MCLTELELAAMWLTELEEAAMWLTELEVAAMCLTELTTLAQSFQPQTLAKGIQPQPHPLSSTLRLPVAPRLLIGPVMYQTVAHGTGHLLHFSTTGDI